LLYSISASLTAGKSVETAFREVEYIVRRLEMNETIEDALEDLAKRSHLEDIQNFTDVLTCKRTGGNLVNVIRNSTNIINDKIEIKEEINTLLAAKKFEQKVLSVMPFIMILILSLTTEDYMAPVFDTIVGRIVIYYYSHWIFCIKENHGHKDLGGGRCCF